MELPVFVSCSRTLSETQEGLRDAVEWHLHDLNLEPVTLGRNHEPVNGMAPLAEISALARHCCGGVILGFAETFVSAATRIGFDQQPEDSGELKIPSPWNQLEAGILLGARVPVLVCREPGIEAKAIFDPQVGDRFVVDLPNTGDELRNQPSARNNFRAFHAAVAARFAELA